MKNSINSYDADVGIIGAGPCGLFQVFELGIHGLSAIVFDAQESIGGQCTELYPNKPIYDIPGLPEIDAAQLIKNLSKQIAPFTPKMVLHHEVTNINKNEANQGFIITTAQDTTYHVKYVVIATGAGAMLPVHLKVSGIDQFENQSLFYRVSDPAIHNGKSIAILGGGDAAFDWALTLQKTAAEVILIHRSNRFRAVQHSVDRFMKLCANHEALFLQGQVTGFEQDKTNLLSAIKVSCADQVVRKVAIDHVLVFFGMAPNITQFKSWGLALEKLQIKVPTHSFETSIEGIYAIGDCNIYPGKKKLILSGFHEAALAAFAIKQRMQPDKKVHLEYTTTSSNILKRLGL